MKSLPIIVRFSLIACSALSLSLSLCAISSVHAADKKQASKSSSAAPTLPARAQRSLELNEQGVVAIKGRDFDRAESLFKQSLEVDEKNLTAVFNLAGMYITNKNDAQAVTLLSKYAKDYPTDAGLQARLGDAYFSSQNPKGAIDSYNRALTLDPNYPNIPARLGTLYTLSNNLPKAAAMFERAIKQNPSDVQSLQNLSSLYLGLDRPKDAVSTAKRAIQLSSSAQGYATLGSAYQQLNDDKNALMAFQRAKELGYKDKNLSDIIEGLEKKLEKNAA
jgi:tetratricopeptide (TPR) repeat protein